MRGFARLPAIALALFVATGPLGCATARPVIRDRALAQARGHQLLIAAARAHGGLARFVTLGGVKLHLRARDPFHLYPAESNWLIDPARNRAVARFFTRSGPVEWRYDGHQATILKNARCVGSSFQRKKVAGLMSNLLFWFGVPFKFLDKGAEALAAGAAPPPEGGPPAPRVLVTYHGVGDTPDDWFVVWLSPETHRISRIVYIASAITKRLEFEGTWERYQDFGGLEVATVRRFAPKRRALAGLAPPVEQQLSQVIAHQPLADAWFAPPAGCEDIQ